MSQDPSKSDRDRLHELLADRAAFRLSVAEQSELEQLARKFPDVDTDQFDRIAAAVELGLGPRSFPAPPTALVGRIARELRDQSRKTAPSPRSSSDRDTPRLATWRFVPWWGWLAAAACLLIAVGVWRDALKPIGPPDLAVARQKLLASQDVVTAPLDKLDPTAAAEGDIVWSSASQQGFMRLRGLPANDPRKSQYQLWIFDKNQDDRYPIDGGVFDIDRNGEVVVPIHAAIKVVDPTMFAITVEKPGGVVVSNRDPIVLLGKVAPN